MGQSRVEQIYLDWTAHVKRAIPAAELLVFRVGKDGYKELAEFLDVPVPNEDYPHVNSAKEFQRVIAFVKLVAVAVAMLVAVTIFFVVKGLIGAMKSKKKHV